MKWQQYKLGDVCDFQGGSQPPKSKFISEPKEGYVRLLQIRDFKSDDKAVYIPDVKKNRVCAADDVMIGRYGASVGQIHRGKSGAYNVALIKTIPNESFICKDFLYLYLQSALFQKALISVAKRSAQAGFSKADISPFNIGLPSLPEQKRIVEILNQVFANIEKARATAETNLKNARELFDSYLFSLLLPVCSSKSTQTLACLTELIVDCEHKTAPTQDEGFPSIRTPNIGKGRLILENVRRVSEETYNLWTRRAVPLPGDLILAREAPAGNVGVIPEGELVCLGQRTVLIRPKVNIVNSQYLAHLLLHPIMQSRLLAHSTGATVQHVNMKDIRALKLSDLPCVSEQVDVVRSLHEVQCKVDWLEKIYLRKVQCLDELKESILQKAFTGELTKSKGIAA